MSVIDPKIQHLYEVCHGSYLKSDECKNAIETGMINLDNEIQTYCDSLGNDAISEPICGCFLKQSVYDNFFSNLNSQLYSAIPPYRTCYFPPCVKSSAYKPYKNNFANTRQDCPNICLVNNTINNDGTISGHIDISGGNDCTTSSPDDDNKNTDNSSSILNTVEAKWSSLTTGEKIGVSCLIIVLLIVLFISLVK